MQRYPNTAKLQSAYRVLYYTETAVARVTSDMLTSTDFVLLSLNVGEAFDTLDQNRLLRGKELFCFDGMVLDCLRSYRSFGAGAVFLSG